MEERKKQSNFLYCRVASLVGRRRNSLVDEFSVSCLLTFPTATFPRLVLLFHCRQKCHCRYQLEAFVRVCCAWDAVRRQQQLAFPVLARIAACHLHDHRKRQGCLVSTVENVPSYAVPFIYFICESRAKLWLDCINDHLIVK